MSHPLMPYLLVPGADMSACEEAITTWETSVSSWWAMEEGGLEDELNLGLLAEPQEEEPDMGRVVVPFIKDVVPTGSAPVAAHVGAGSIWAPRVKPVTRASEKPAELSSGRGFGGVLVGAVTPKTVLESCGSHTETALEALQTLDTVTASTEIEQAIEDAEAISVMFKAGTVDPVVQSEFGFEYMLIALVLTALDRLEEAERFLSIAEENMSDRRLTILARNARAERKIRNRYNEHDQNAFLAVVDRVLAKPQTERQGLRVEVLYAWSLGAMGKHESGYYALEDEFDRFRAVFGQRSEVLGRALHIHAVNFYQTKRDPRMTVTILNAAIRAYPDDDERNLPFALTECAEYLIAFDQLETAKERIDDAFERFPDVVAGFATSNVVAADVYARLWQRTRDVSYKAIAQSYYDSAFALLEQEKTILLFPQLMRILSLLQ